MLKVIFVNIQIIHLIFEFHSNDVSRQGRKTLAYSESKFVCFCHTTANEKE